MGDPLAIPPFLRRAPSPSGVAPAPRGEVPGLPHPVESRAVPPFSPTERPRLNAPNREAWLTCMVEGWRSKLAPLGPLPRVRIACGFPSKMATARNARRAECWASSQSADGVHEIFISPLEDDPFEIAKIVLHELLHALVGVEHGHGAAFKQAARKVGLAGSARSSRPTDWLAAFIRDRLLPELGPYPHARLQPDARKPQSTRLLKAVCRDCGGYCVRITRKWLVDLGPPICPSCRDPLRVEDAPEEQIVTRGGTNSHVE